MRAYDEAFLSTILNQNCSIFWITLSTSFEKRVINVYRLGLLFKLGCLLNCIVHRIMKCRRGPPTVVGFEINSPSEPTVTFLVVTLPDCFSSRLYSPIDSDTI